MKAKEYLSQFRLLKARIKTKEERRDVIFSLISSARTPQLKKDIVQGGEKADVEDQIIEYLSLQDELNADIRQAVELARSIGEKIDRLDNHLYVEVLHRHYIGLRDLKIIAEELNYSHVHVKRVHGYALLAFQRKFLKDDTR